MWDINYFSVFFLIKEALPYLRKQPGSSIVIVSSYTGYEMDRMIGHYALTKTALLGLVKNLAK
jgi:dehydrogenase/reductase SDR family protein 4